MVTYVFLYYTAYSAKLHHNAAAVHIPIGLEGQHKGVIDIINNKAVYFEGDLGYAHCKFLNFIQCHKNQYKVIHNELR